jgi:hypothetical protein
MPIAQMAASPPIERTKPEPEPGAPIPRDAIDPDLVKLARKRPQIGLITALGVIAVCFYYIVTLGPDRRFAGEPETPRPVALADIITGKIPYNSYIALDADPLMSHAIRASTESTDPGNRVVPVRGAGERVWLVIDGNGKLKPNLKSYVGRLRRIGDLKSAHVLDVHATRYPRPTFATVAAVRAGLASGDVATVAGDNVRIGAGDKVAFDVIDPARATVIVRAPADATADHGPLPDANAWIAELAKHGVTATVAPVPGEADSILSQVRLDVAMSVDQVTEKLEAAKLYAARVERVTRHHETTWSELAAAPAKLPEGDALIGLFVRRGIPADSYALIENEQPQDYWYVMPITIVLGIFGLLFTWALARAVRDLLPVRVR